MGIPVVVVESGGLPVTESDNGAPMTVADNGFGLAVTLVESGGLPVAGVGAAEPVAIEFVDSEVSTSDLTTFTFSGVSLGAAFSGRKIVVGIGGRSVSGLALAEPTTVTVGGVTASLIPGATLQFATGNASRIAIFEADVPTGTTGDVVVTWPAASARCGIGVWAVANAASLADVGTSVADPATDTLTVPANGGMVGYAFQTHSTTGVTAAWTGLTSKFDAQVETNTTHSGASDVSEDGGAIALTCDWSATPGVGGAAVFVAFGP